MRDPLYLEIESLRQMLADKCEECEKLRAERDAALPWKMFYGEGKNLGEIAEHFGKTIYAFSPWLTAPATRIVMDAVEVSKK